MKTNLLGLACAALLPLAACGGDDSTTNKHDLSVATTDDLAMSGDLAGVFLVVEGCGEGDYVDGRTDATKRVVSPWNPSLGKLCIHVTAGQTVTWPGVPTNSHPLEAHDTASTAGNPIKNVSVNTFPSAGTFGYDCEIHHTLMHGAIWVDPS